MLNTVLLQHLSLHVLGLPSGFSPPWLLLFTQDISQVLSPLPQLLVMCSSNYQI